MKKVSYLVVMSLSLLSTAASAQDWPQYLGPNRNNHSSEKGMIRSWPETGPEVLWSVEVGRGYGGPVIKDGKAYLLDRDDEVGDIMRCFDMNTGKELWKHANDTPGEIPFPGSRSVPVTDGKHVWACGQNGDLFCYDVNGKLVWKKNVWTDFGGGRFPIWGISQCPFIYDNKLIIASQGGQTGVVAYNKETGDVIWKTPQIGPYTYSSPSLATIHGQDQVVFVASSADAFAGDDSGAKGSVVGLNIQTGEELWRYPNWECIITVPTAVEAGDNKLLITGGYDRGATMLQITKEGGKFGVKELFTTLNFGDQTKTPTLHNGYFYAHYRTNQKRDGLVCMDMNGNVKWKSGAASKFDRGAIIVADELMFVTDGLANLYLIEPSPDGFKPISKYPLLGEGGAKTDGMMQMGGATQNWAPMALAGGKLLVRSQTRMYCVKVSK